MDMNTILIFALLILAIIVLAFFVFRTNTRVTKLLQGKNASNLEDSFNYISEEIKRMNENEALTEKALNNLNTRLKKSLTGFKTVRFNPFPEQGGNQSFAIAVINEEGDGFILSSLYSREKTSVFAKPIKAGKSTIALTEEEAKALAEAK